MFNAGKTDKKIYTLKLWADKNKLFCPVLALQTYIYMIGIKKGHLFPTDAELSKPPADGDYKTYQKYATMLARLKRLFTKMTGDPNGWGTHTLRKTAYLFGIWQIFSHNPNAGADAFKLIMDSARHHDVNSAKKYEMDARSRLHNWSSHKVSVKKLLSPFVQILVVTSGNQHRNQPGRLSSDACWFELAKLFMEKYCQVDQKDADYGVPYCIRKVMAFRPEVTGKDMYLAVKARANLPLDIANDFDEAVERMLDEKVSSTLLSLPVVDETTGLDQRSKRKRSIVELQPRTDEFNYLDANKLSTTPATFSNSIEKKRKKVGSSALKSVAGIASFADIKAGDAKIDAILRIEKEIADIESSDTKKTGLTRLIDTAAQNFYYRTCLPVKACLSHCFANDAAKFLEAKGKKAKDNTYKFSHSRYKCENCPKK